MPIKIPKDLPAAKILAEESVFVMDDQRAFSQDIRPLRILILNLMPTKVVTETQLARVLANTPLQIEMSLLTVSSRQPRHTSHEHMIAFYRTLNEVRDEYYDGMIITGAPVELLPFEEVDYWPELCEIMEWSRSHVFSTLHICWGAQAGLFYHFGVPKHTLSEKLFGVFPHHTTEIRSPLFRGFDDFFYIPHSRHTTVRREDVEHVPGLQILAESDTAGMYALATPDSRQIFLMGHSEYDPDTLSREYFRDKEAGLPIHIPYNYFPEDDDTRQPVCRWRSCGHLLYGNWVNYVIYQETPFDVRSIPQLPSRR